MIYLPKNIRGTSYAARDAATRAAHINTHLALNISSAITLRQTFVSSLWSYIIQDVMRKEGAN